MTHESPTLIVDDDARFRERLARAFHERGIRTFMAHDYDSAMQIAQRHTLERAVVDLRMPGKHGLILVKDLQTHIPDIAIVVLTGYGSIATAVDAMRSGAINYLTKPATPEQILLALEPDHDELNEEALRHDVPSLARLEWEHIERVLRDCGGNISKAARVLGMHRRTLQYKLAKYPPIR